MILVHLCSICACHPCGHKPVKMKVFRSNTTRQDDYDNEDEDEYEYNNDESVQRPSTVFVVFVVFVVVCAAVVVVVVCVVVIVIGIVIVVDRR